MSTKTKHWRRGKLAGGCTMLNVSVPKKIKDVLISLIPCHPTGTISGLATELIEIGLMHWEPPEPTPSEELEEKEKEEAEPV